MVLTQRQAVGIGLAADLLDGSEGDGRASEVTGAIEQPVFRSELTLGGEDRRVDRPEHRRAIVAPERDWRERELGWGEPEGCELGGVGDHRDHRFAVGGGGEAPVHRLSRGFGHEVPSAPGRAFLTDGLDDGAADVADHVERDVIGPQQQRPVVVGGVHRPAGRVAAEDRGGSSSPFLGQIGKGSDLLVGPG